MKKLSPQAVGVAFSRELRAEFGVYVSLLLAVGRIRLD